MFYIPTEQQQQGDAVINRRNQLLSGLQEEPRFVQQYQNQQPQGSMLDWLYRKEMYKNLFRKLLGDPKAVEDFLKNIGTNLQEKVRNIPTPRVDVSKEGLKFSLEKGFGRLMDYANLWEEGAKSLGREYLGGGGSPTPTAQPPIPAPKPTPKPTVTPSTPPEEPVPSGQVGEPMFYTSPDVQQARAAADKQVETAQAFGQEPPYETPAIAEASNVPDFSKLVKPWKPSVDYEKELIRIFNESVPNWEDLPKSTYKEPSTPKDFFKSFIKYSAVASMGKDPMAFKRQEFEDAEAAASRQRDFVIKRASQLGQLRISALTEKMRREDSERQNKSQYLQFLGTQHPEIRKQPYYQAAVASVAGISPEEAEDFLAKHVDPKTGLLESFYKNPNEIAVEQKQAMLDFSVKQTMEATGYDKERAKYIVFTGKDDPQAWLQHKYQRAIALPNNDPTKPMAIAQAVKDIRQWRMLNSYDPEREQAIALLLDLEDPAKSKKIRSLFSSEQGFQYFKDYNVGMALGAKGFKPATPKEMGMDEKIVREAQISLGNEKLEDGFELKYGVAPRIAIGTYMKWGAENGINIPEPYNTIKKFFTKYAGKYGDVTIDPDMMNSVNQDINARFANEFMEINRTLPKKQQLTQQEVWDLATEFATGNPQRITTRIREIYATRKLPVPGTVQNKK